MGKGGVFSDEVLFSSGDNLPGTATPTTAACALAVNDNRVAAIEADIDPSGAAIILRADGASPVLVVKTGDTLPGGGVVDSDASLIPLVMYIHRYFSVQSIETILVAGTPPFPSPSASPPPRSSSPTTRDDEGGNDLYSSSHVTGKRPLQIERLRVEFNVWVFAVDVQIVHV